MRAIKRALDPLGIMNPGKAAILNCLGAQCAKTTVQPSGLLNHDAVVRQALSWWRFFLLVFRHKVEAMNSAQRADCGLPKTWSGGPSSSTMPWFKKMARVDASRANFISCVTTSIVTCSSARRRITCSTSDTSSGSRAEVGSSNSINSGRIASARAIAALCCWPPDSWEGNIPCFSLIPTRSNSCRASASASFLARPRTWTGAAMTF